MEEDDGFDEQDSFMAFGANEENKALQREIKLQERHLAQIEADLDENCDRRQAIEDHVRNVQQEVQQSQGVLEEHKRERESELHLKVVEDAERKRLKGELAALETQLRSVLERLNAHQNNIFRSQEQMENIKEEMQWSQAQYDEHVRLAQEKEEDIRQLQKYTRADEGKINALTLQIEKLAVEVQKASHALEREATDTHEARVALEKAGEAFRHLHRERQGLVAQWEKAIRLMHARDEELATVADEYRALKQQHHQKVQALREQDDFLEQEQQANSERARQAERLDALLDRTQGERARKDTELKQFLDEVTNLQTTLGRTATDVKVRRADVGQLQRDCAERRQRMVDIQTEIEGLTAQVATAQQSSMTAEQRAIELEELLVREQKRENEVLGQLQRLQAVKVQREQTVFELRQEHNMLTNQISGVQASTANLMARSERADQAILQQQQVMYKQDFKIARLERQEARLSGTLPEAEQNEADTKVSELNQALAAEEQVQKLLDQQLRQVDDDIRQTKRQLEQSDVQQKNLQGQLQEVHLYIKTTQEQSDKLVRQREDLMVEENLLKLQIRRLHKALSTRADKVLSLEQRKLQLETAMQERTEEIQIHMEVLKTELKATVEHRGSLSKDLRQVVLRVDQLKKKYEIVTMALTPTDGGEPTSQAAHIVKVTQERAELQRLGDELDAQIQKDEKEVRALANTLALMKGRNEEYRQTLRSMGHDSHQVQAKEELEAQYQTAMDAYKEVRQQIREQQDMLERLEAARQTASRQRQNQQEMVAAVMADLSGLERELAEQQAKKDRAVTMAEKVVQQHRSATKAQGETPEEIEFRLRHMRSVNRKVLEKLGDLSAHHPDLAPGLNMLLSREGIVMPHPGVSASRGSSMATSSAASSVRSGRSVRSVASLASTTNRGATRTAADAVTAHTNRAGKAVTPTTLSVGVAGLTPVVKKVSSRPSSTASSRTSSTVTTKRAAK